LANFVLVQLAVRDAESWANGGTVWTASDYCTTAKCHFKFTFGLS